MRTAAIFLAIALLATSILIGCSEQPKTVGTTQNAAGDATSVAQIEDTFDRGFEESEVTSATNDLDPKDFDY